MSGDLSIVESLFYVSEIQYVDEPFRLYTLPLLYVPDQLGNCSDNYTIYTRHLSFYYLSKTRLASQVFFFQHF